MLSPYIDNRPTGDYNKLCKKEIIGLHNHPSKGDPAYVDHDLYASPRDPLQRGLPTLARS